MWFLVNEPRNLNEGPAEKIRRAEKLAGAAHVNQQDKLGQDYIAHPERVATRLLDPVAKQVAWLHDILEDTEIGESDLRRQFDDDVVDAVVVLTRTEDVTDDEYYSRIAAHPVAKVVKLADIADNTDPRRTGALDEESRVRLAAKYGHALDLLLEPLPTPHPARGIADTVSGGLPLS